MVRPWGHASTAEIELFFLRVLETQLQWRAHGQGSPVNLSDILSNSLSLSLCLRLSSADLQSVGGFRDSV